MTMVKARTMPIQKWIYILPKKFAIVRSVQFANGSQKVANYAMAVFNSKCTYKNLAASVSIPQTTQSLVISHSCFAEDSKEMHKDL